MKKTSMLTAALCCMIFNAFATVHVVNVADFQFSPSSLTIPFGDSVKWVWINGTHTTTSTSVPAGATPWDQPITPSNKSFIYKPAVAGMYEYKCTPHLTMGMTAIIIVAPPTGVGNVTQQVFKMFPNPVSGMLNLQLQESAAVNITLTDIKGAIVFQNKYDGAPEVIIDLKNIPEGQYIVTAVQGDRREQQELMVAH